MRNKNEIQSWLTSQISQMVELSAASVDVHAPFSSYGLSSLDVVTLSGELETFLDKRLSPTLAYDYPSIEQLADYLSGDITREHSTLTTATNSHHPDPIAIIGIACRFPGADNTDQFWELLRDGVEAISEVPADRWNSKDFYHPDSAAPGKTYSTRGGFLKQVDQFDPFFFDISPAEAKTMDPQQRLLLELSYEALDDAMQEPGQLNGSNTGVFIGISGNEYSHFQWNHPKVITAHSGTGNALSVAANRISYFFNFNGPSIAIDTACSSSLAAVHLACQSLKNSECNMAVTGGVNIILSPGPAIAFTKAGVLSPAGRCKTFDALADGYVRGEGGGVVILKRLALARADGDRIYALIPGSAMVQDGRTNGLMAPSRTSQKLLLKQAYKNAGIHPDHVQYIEAHGTGTLIGDSIEAQAIGAVVGVPRTKGCCSIGSVKTNIGHLEAAAGMAGLIKVILSLKNRMLPPSLHYHAPNPYIPFDELKISVQCQLQSWPKSSSPATAGVSSFGFGGTSVHVVISEPPIPEENKEVRDGYGTGDKYYLLPLSANNHNSLRDLAKGFQPLLSPDRSSLIEAICRSAGLRRSHNSIRIAAVGQSVKDLKQALDAFLAKRPDFNLFVQHGSTGINSKVAFVFSGQGGQWLGMGSALLSVEPVFRATIESLDRLIAKYGSYSLKKFLSTESSLSDFHEIDIVQPAIFAVQVALANLWKSWGVNPGAVVGHSMGEVAAAYIGGLLTLEDAVKVMCSRSELLKRLSGRGKMLATELSLKDANVLLQGYESKVSVGAINSRFSTILSGDADTIDELMDSLNRQNIFCKLVNVDVASHSPQITALRKPLVRALEGLAPVPASVPFYSTVTGTRGDTLLLNAEYWLENLSKPVLFHQATDQLVADGYRIFIEIGPHPLLLGSIQQSVEPLHENIHLLPSMRRDQPTKKVMFESLGILYTQGLSVDWKKLYPKSSNQVSLPAIPWNRQRFWIEDDIPQDHHSTVQKSSGKCHPLLGKRIDLANTMRTSVWETNLTTAVMEFLADHEVDGLTVFPAAGYIEMALQAIYEKGMTDSFQLCDFLFQEKIVLAQEHLVTLQGLLTQHNDEQFSFQVFSKSSSNPDWILNATVSIKKIRASGEFKNSGWSTVEEILESSTLTYNSEELYRSLQLRGVKYGPGFRGVEQLWSYKNEVLGRVRLPENSRVEVDLYQNHPALLDACFQVLAGLPVIARKHDLYLPVKCERVSRFFQVGEVCWSQVCLRPDASPDMDNIIVDIRLLNPDHIVAGEIIGMHLHRLSRQKIQQQCNDNIFFYKTRWQIQEPSLSTEMRANKKNWLVFDDGKGLGELLVAKLEKAGDTCVVLQIAEVFELAAEHGETASAEIISKCIAASPTSFNGIIHLWSMSTGRKENIGTATGEAIRLANCTSILFLIQALADSTEAWPHLWLVTRGAQAIKSESIDPQQALPWGLGKVIGFEFPDLKCTCIDLDPEQDNENSIHELIEQLEINDRENQVALRSGRRWVPRLTTFLPGSGETPPISLNNEGAYLITGGLGGLGFNVAKWMVERGAKHIVLMSRSGASQEVEDWAGELNNTGICIKIFQGDVSDFSSVESVIKHFEKSNLILRGVVHAAGVLDDDSLLSLNAARFKKVLLPKVDGARNLHIATKDLPLDFFVLFSSAVSVLGSPGQGNYAAANSYLDSMAHFRHQLGLPCISINWGPWGEVGLAAGVTQKLSEQNAPSQHLVKVIGIRQGLEVLERLLSTPEPQLMVLPFDLKNLIELYPVAGNMPFLSEVGGLGEHAGHFYVRPNLRQEYVAPRNTVQRKLAILWQQTLHIDRMGIADSFFELGGDSVLATQVLALIQKTFGIRINPQDAFKAFTIEQLAEMLEKEIRNKIELMSEEEVLLQLKTID